MADVTATADVWPRQDTAHRHDIDLGRFARQTADREASIHLLVEGVHCGGCIRKIEARLLELPDVTGVRLNFTTRRLSVHWRGGAARANEFGDCLHKLGYGVAPFVADTAIEADAREQKILLRCLAVAGFATANVMLLSIAVWAGQYHQISATTVTLLHWFSALVALPAVAYAGLPFFGSAASALRHGRTNMDVPISLAVVLTSGMSLFETIQGGPHTYFDSVVALLFFLLIGRYLDRRARGKARGAAGRLLALQATAVTVLAPDGRTRQVDQADVVPGMIVLVAAGERIAVDGTVKSGLSDADTSLINGETVPVPLAQGDEVFAGTMNLGGAITVEVTKTSDCTLLAEIVRLLEVAEQRRARYVDLADRIARLYAPAVHALAAATFVGWVVIGGIAWQQALLYAVAVLIITCPCALGLAVPVVQVIASGRLMRRGILLKSGNALERLARIDSVVFDKTGTLTEGQPTLAQTDADLVSHRLAASIAATSNHPLARALAASVRDAGLAEGVREVPGLGLSQQTSAGEVRVGSRAWCGVDDDDSMEGPELWLRQPNGATFRFAFADKVRGDAAAIVAALRDDGLPVALVSGDRPRTVKTVARETGIERWQASSQPADKVSYLETLAHCGARTLMVGDGLNDAPALGAAHVSMSPTTAADVTQTAADIVFQGTKLRPVAEALNVARRADRLVKQNIGLSFLYNAIAIPFAVAGFVTPLVAAISMSASSLLVIGNAMRLGR